MTVAPKSSKIPYIFLAFFAVIIVVNVGYIYISKKTWRGVVTEDSYQKGVEYNKTIEREKKQSELGWQVTPRYVRTSETSGMLIVGITDKNSITISDAEVFVNFKRPTQENFDFTLPLKFSAEGYGANVTFPLKGQWDANIEIVKGQDSFRFVKRYIIQ